MIQQLNFPHDSGPIYQETIAGRFPVEPFNTYSNLIFIGILIFFVIKIYKDPKHHLFLCSCIPIIFISWIGGTLYHATRSHEVWLVMDWLPIMIVCLMATIYFIGKIKQKWSDRILLLIFFLAANIIFRSIPIPPQYRISIGYGITAFTVLTPFFWYAYLSQWKNVRLLLIGFLVFGIAVLFRTMDGQIELLPMGTHWLWHTFGGVAVFFLLYFVYRDDLESA